MKINKILLKFLTESLRAFNKLLKEVRQTICLSQHLYWLACLFKPFSKGILLKLSCSKIEDFSQREDCTKLISIAFGYELELIYTVLPSSTDDLLHDFFKISYCKKFDMHLVQVVLVKSIPFHVTEHKSVTTFHL